MRHVFSTRLAAVAAFAASSLFLAEHLKQRRRVAQVAQWRAVGGS